jgi:hypothetical protein
MELYTFIHKKTGDVIQKLIDEEISKEFGIQLLSMARFFY